MSSDNHGSLDPFSELAAAAPESDIQDILLDNPERSSSAVACHDWTRVLALLQTPNLPGR